MGICIIIIIYFSVQTRGVFQKVDLTNCEPNPELRVDLP